jgi:branched-chain amino acid aminotransferase
VSVRQVYIDGQFIPEQDAKLSLHDAGFVWGATVTDRVRTYRRRLFRLTEHLRRFRRSCELCRIPQSVPDAELTRLAEHLIEHNGSLIPREDELVLIIFATPGNHSPNLGLIVEPLDASRYQPLIARGARLITPPTRQILRESVPPEAKMRNRMHWWIAEQQVRDIDPTASAILLDTDDHLTETASANFAIVQNNSLLVPSRASVLDGVSLRVIEELCTQLSISFLERPISVEDCQQCDEAILTSTSFGVCGVSSFNSRPIPWPGKVLEQLRAAWSDLVGIDIWRDFHPCG